MLISRYKQHDKNDEAWLVRVWGSPYIQHEFICEGTYDFARKIVISKYPEGFIWDITPFVEKQLDNQQGERDNDIIRCITVNTQYPVQVTWCVDDDLLSLVEV